MGINELKSDALKLNPQDRAFLASELIDSLDELNQSEIEQLWINEALRRENEIICGRATTDDAYKVMKRLKAERK